MLLLSVSLNLVDFLQGRVVHLDLLLSDSLHMGDGLLDGFLLFLLRGLVNGLGDGIALLLRLGLVHFFHVLLDGLGRLSLLSGDSNLEGGSCGLLHLLLSRFV